MPGLDQEWCIVESLRQLVYDVGNEGSEYVPLYPHPSLSTVSAYPNLHSATGEREAAVRRSLLRLCLMCLRHTLTHQCTFLRPMLAHRKRMRRICDRNDAFSFDADNEHDEEAWRESKAARFSASERRGHRLWQFSEEPVACTYSEP